MTIYELILTIGSFFLFGVTVGKFLGERATKEVFKPLLDKYFTQKNEMWKEIRRRIRC